MANARSDLMANILASPPVRNEGGPGGGRVRCKRGVVNTAVADAAGIFYVIARFLATDRILSVQLHNEVAWTAAAGTADVGFYEAGDWTAADQAVKDADSISDNIAGDATRLVPTEILGFGTNAVKVGERVWEYAGDTAAPTPGTQYDMVMTATTDPNAAAALEFQIYYLAGD